jgi:hypothetical protein
MRPQPEQDFRPLDEPFGRIFFTHIFFEMLADEDINVNR